MGVKKVSAYLRRRIGRVRQLNVLETHKRKREPEEGGGKAATPFTANNIMDGRCSNDGKIYKLQTLSSQVGMSHD